MDKTNQKKELEVLEASMLEPDFWIDKNKAQTTIKRIAELKAEVEGGGTKAKYDKGDAVMTIFSGAGGDDSEDFSKMLLNMYFKFCSKNNFNFAVLHENQNDNGGYRNVTVEISGRSKDGVGAYGILKNESGVHRLVRISPFNSLQKRHTSFSLVEVIPKFSATSKDVEIPEKDLRIEFSRSSGPGGQNANKRETAVRVVHIPTNLAAESQNERSQLQNKEKAISILKGKIYKALEDKRISEEKGMYISKTTQIEWGSQIRSYVLHPYKMVKDHRTGVETAKVDNVLSGDIDEFVEAEKDL